MQERMYINNKNELVVADTLLEKFYAYDKDVFIYLTDETFRLFDLTRNCCYQIRKMHEEKAAEYFKAQESLHVIERSFMSSKAIVSANLTLMDQFQWDYDIEAFPIFIAYHKDGILTIANVQELTERQLMPAHNIEKLYRAEEFKVWEY